MEEPRLNLSEIEIELLGDEIIERLFRTSIDDEKDGMAVRKIYENIDMFGVEFEVEAKLETYLEYYGGSYDTPPDIAERFKDIYICDITAWGDNGEIEYNMGKIPILLDNYIEEKKRDMQGELQI